MGIKITEGQMDFFGLLNEYDDSQGARVTVREPGRKTVPPAKSQKTGHLTIKDGEPEQIKLDFEKLAAIEEPKVVEVPKAVEEPKVVEAPKVKEEPEAKTDSEPILEKEENTDKIVQSELLFKQCKKCWCFDCKHNSKNEGVPRDMCGTRMRCPACDSCIAEDQATICEIGNAKEGCKLRAEEEGILVNEDYSEF